LSTSKLVYVKIHITPSGTLVAACDAELLDKVIEDPERKIKIHISPSFYRGELVTPRGLLDALKSADMANLVGEESVKIAVVNGLVHPDAVVRIRGIPVAYFTKI
jgi:hypothetical protein